MAEAGKQSKIDAAAEKAYESAAAKTASAEKVADAVQADAPKATASAKVVKKAVAKKAPVKKAPARKTAAKATPAKTAAAKKPTAKKAPAKKAPAKVAAKTAAQTSTNPVTKLKDTIMATAEKTDFTAQAKEMAADVQTRVKDAYSKAGELASEAGEFNKANLEAVVESGKIFFNGAQEIVRSDVETGKSVVETVTEDAKKAAAVKSPTEFMQLQGEIARRNFDAVVSFGSKRTETIVKLYNDAFAPISNRVSVAAEKISKAA
ncbi:MAG: phasin family protein [Pseudomonadota bacterium]|nr:phasin family protein [Pseudomonadota bacterium]